MLRVLTLSTLFPNAVEPTLGVFVERQTLGLAALGDVEVEVVAPIGLPRAPLHLHPHYRDRARLPQSEQWQGLTIHRPHYPVLPLIGQARTAASMARALLPKLREIRTRFPFDVIDAEFFWPDGPAAMRLSRALGVPFSIKARGSDIQYWGAKPAIRSQLKEAAVAAGGLLTVSQALKRVMTGLGMPEEKIAVHYTGVDGNLFAPADRAAAKMNLGISGPLIVSAGALVPRKGQRLVIEAMPRLPTVQVILVGDGPERPALEALVRDKGLTNRVRFVGNLPHDALPGIFAAADAMVLPSEAEGLANVWVESLACGTPVVIADAGGAREVVDRPEAGRIVDRDPDALAKAVWNILHNPPDPQAVRDTVRSFDWERNATELRAHLARIVRSGSGAHSTTK